MAERQLASRIIQYAIESTAARGTPVAASKQAALLMYEISPQTETKSFGAHGRLHSQDVQLLHDWVNGTYAFKSPEGEEAVSYAELAYVLAGLVGAPVITTPAGAQNARQMVFDMPLVAPRNPVTKTVQVGDTGGVRTHQAAYVLETGLTLKADPTKVAGSGNLIAQAMTDPATLTPTPTRLPIVNSEIMGTDWSIYRDYTSAGLGSTKLSRCYEYGFDYTDVYAPHWTGDRAQGADFAVHVDNPGFKSGLSLLLQADANGMTGLSDLRAQQLLYVRWEAIGALIDNLQVLTIAGGPTGGTFTLTYKGQTTAAIAYNATAAAVASALQLLSGIGANGCTVSGSSGGPWTVAFTGTLAQDTTLLTHTDSFTGGTSPSLGIVQTTYARRCTIDAACRYRNKIDIKDGNDVLEVQYDLELVEDPTWGHAAMVTLVNTLTAL